MDTHKLTRGARLNSWIEANGGATACLIGAGYEQGTDAFKSRESFISQARRKGMGHPAALRFEREFEVLGMRPGYLTNNLDEDAQEDVRPHDSAKFSSVAELRLMRPFDLAHVPASLPGTGSITVIAKDDLPGLIPRGAFVDVDLTDREPADGSVFLARKAGGAVLLGTAWLTHGGFELDTGRMRLHHQDHALTVLGRATDVHVKL